MLRYIIILLCDLLKIQQESLKTQKEESMAERLLIGLVAIVVMTIGNFVWEFISLQGDWQKAKERSFFQAAAVIIYFLLLL